MQPAEGCIYRVLRRLHKNGVIKIMYKQEEANDESIYDSDSWYNEENRVVDAIRSNTAIAVYDASVKDNIIGGWQKITNERNKVLASDYIGSN